MTLPRCILVPTDFSRAASAALDYAIELAERVGAEIHLAHFYAFPVPVGPLEGQDWDVVRGGIARDAARRVARIARKRARPGVAIAASAVAGDPRSGIRDVAAALGADLICMGTHGRQGLERLLRGSVAEHTVRTSRVPTLTIHAATPRAADARARKPCAPRP